MAIVNWLCSTQSSFWGPGWSGALLVTVIEGKSKTEYILALKNLSESGMSLFIASCWLKQDTWPCMNPQGEEIQSSPGGGPLILVSSQSVYYEPLIP